MLSFNASYMNTFPFLEVNICISWKQLIVWLSEEQTKDKIKKKKLMKEPLKFQVYIYLHKYLCTH